MPLLNGKPFVLSEKPGDLKPNELIYQVRFTKEIFRDYHQYLKRVNFYRQRIWTCKVTGKANLTYEEALVSEKHRVKKVKKFPEEWLKPVLQIIQFSMVPLQELVDTIRSTARKQLVMGLELSGKKDDAFRPCKVIRVVKGDGKTRYEVGWLDSDKNIICQSVMNEDDLISEKLSLSIHALKSFIRESTCQCSPWVVHEKLARKYGISTIPPEEIKMNFIYSDSLFVRNNKRGKIDDDGEKNGKRKKVKVEYDAKKEAEPVKFPIDDLLLPCALDDSVLTMHSCPSAAFIVPSDCVADLLMVWNFCSSFSRMLNLLPFSLDDFQRALCHRDSTPVIIVETHSAILCLLIKEGGEYSTITKKTRKLKVNILNWAEYLSDLLEMLDIHELSTWIATIKRGHYSFLDANTKLGILRELVSRALETDIFRHKLDENIEQRQALVSSRREETIEENRKKREELKCLKAESDNNFQSLESAGNNLYESNNSKENGHCVEKINRSSDDKLAKESEVEKRSKEKQKEYFEREVAKLGIRSNPLGKDRHYNRYWFFRCDGRVFVENSDFVQWGYYSTKEEVDVLMSSLNCKGVRELALHIQLKKHYHTICLEMQKRCGKGCQNSERDESVLRRSTRVRAPPRENPALAFLKYENKWNQNSSGV